MQNGYYSFWVCLPLSLLMAPLAIGVINKVKAFFAGRHGVSIFQLYYDLFKLRQKESIHSTSSTWILRITPLFSLGFIVCSILFLPLGSGLSPLGFTGDAVLFFYLLGTARFLTVLAALDTGSSFEGMGASREVQFSALAEGAIFALLAFLAANSGELDLNSMLNGSGISAWNQNTALVLAAVAFFIVLLAENCRVPFDDPETHLELTMIHEAMILDFSGKDLAAILYGAAVKFWIFASFLVLMLLPHGMFPLPVSVLIYFAGVLCVAVLVGIVESSMARYRFLKVPPLLTAALALALVAIFFITFFTGGAR